jgi:acetyl esterase/lipase
VEDSREVLTRPAAPPDLTVAYGEHPDQVADVRVPASPGPLVMFWHGGFWRDPITRSYTGPLAVDLAGRGYAVASLEYRRTGGAGGWPATFDDVALAAEEVPRLIAAAGVEFTGVIYAGHSAGGHLAAWAATRSVDVLGVVALAPVLDLAEAYRLDLDGGAVLALLGGGPDEVPDRYAYASMPVPQVPVALVHGDRDTRVPVEMSRAYAERTGHPLTELPGVGHFAIVDPLTKPWESVVATLERVARR